MFLFREHSKPQCSYKIVPIKETAPQNLKDTYFPARLYVWFMRYLKIRLNLIYNYGSSNQDNFYKKRYPEYLRKILGQQQCPPVFGKSKQNCIKIEKKIKTLPLIKIKVFTPPEFLVFLRP